MVHEEKGDDMARRQDQYGARVLWKGVPAMRMTFVAGLTKMHHPTLDATTTRNEHRSTIPTEYKKQ